MNILSRIAAKAHREAQNMLALIGAEQIVMQSQKGAAIICYHGIDTIESKELNMRFYSIKSLETHFSYFKKYFNVISVQDYFLEKFSTQKFNIAITFDDGYRNNFKYLLPLTEKYQLPVSIYVTGLNQTPFNCLWADFADILIHFSDLTEIEISGEFFLREKKFCNIKGESLHQWIKKQGTWNFKQELYEKYASDFHKITTQRNISDYWELMSDKEIIEAAKSKFITIGSHGFFHNNLGNISPTDAAHELAASKKYLENLLQKEVNELAYPDGSFNQQTIDAAKQQNLKFQLALETKEQCSRERGILNRYGMYPVYSNINQLAAIPSIEKVH